MEKSHSDWKSFRDIATPEAAARVLTDWYGRHAARHAAECGLAARGDDRDEDYRFWCDVFAMLRADSGATGRSRAAS